MRSTVMRGGFVGAGAAFTTGRSTVSGRCATGATRAPGPMMPERMAPGTPSRSPPTTPHCMTCPAPAVSGGSTMIRATAGTLAGMMRAFGKTRAAAARERGGTTFGPGGGGGGGAPGVTSVVTRNARPKVCGEIIGASSAQPIIIAWPVKPMAVAQTLDRWRRRAGSHQRGHQKRAPQSLRRDHRSQQRTANNHRLASEAHGGSPDPLGGLAVGKCCRLKHDVLLSLRLADTLLLSKKLAVNV